MLVNGWHSDRTAERLWHVAVPLAMLGIGVMVTALLDGVRGAGGDHDRRGRAVMYAHLPAFWPIPIMVLGATTAASAIGFINMIGNFGGFVGPAMVGDLANNQTSFAPAPWRLAPWPFFAVVVILITGYTRLRKKVPAQAMAELPPTWDSKFAEMAPPEERITGESGG